jgi:K+-sensing histidine kinase KdpD
LLDVALNMSRLSEQPENDSPAVPWSDLVKFVRQLSHDIRNNLNAVELQSAFLAELAEEGEMKNEVQRLREMISQIGTSLQRLTSGLSQNNPNLISYPAADFVQDLKPKLAKEFPDNAAKVTWDVELKDATLQVDPQLVQQAFLEIFGNAFHHERNIKSIAAKAYVDKNRFVFELREPKARFELSTAHWGREPLRNVSQGHYGLGLNRARSIAEAHGGDFRADYDRKTSTLTTIFTLPAFPAGKS